MPREAAILLFDIEDAAAEAIHYIEGMDLDAFSVDRKTQAAVAYRLIVVGEAMNRLPSELKGRIPESVQAIGLRNYLAHEYEGIDMPIIWDTVNDSLPVLCKTVGALLTELDREAEAAAGKPPEGDTAPAGDGPSSA